jgi:hypothetical protein
MSKRTPVVEWYMAESDAEWTRLCAPPLLDNTPCAVLATQNRSLSRQFLWKKVAVLLLLAGIGGWWWYTASTQPQQSERGRSAIAQRGDPLTPLNGVTITGQIADQQASAEHRVTMAGQGQVTQEYSALYADLQTGDTSAHRDMRLQTVEFQGDQAIARVVTAATNGTPAYRQTRFFVHTGEGWQQTSPDPALWGPERRLETPSFSFHFRQNDAPSVIAVAPQIEALYSTLQHNFGLSFPPGVEKLVIEVRVTQTPGQVIGWFLSPIRFVVPSPAVYQAPVEMTDTELLAQSIALPLLEHALLLAHSHHTILATWQPMESGLRLWQLWDLDLPLSTWREEVVKWIYVALPAPRPGQPVVQPGHYPELCAAHKLWMPSPAQLSIPLLCLKPHWEESYLAPWAAHEPPTRLAQLAAPMSLDRYAEMASQMSQQNYPG